METTPLSTRAGVKRRRSAVKSKVVSGEYFEERRPRRQLGEAMGILTNVYKMPGNIFGLSVRLSLDTNEPFTRDFLPMSTRPLKRRAPHGPSCNTRSRRFRSSCTAMAWWRVAVALACIASLSCCMPLCSAAAVAALVEDYVHSAQSARLCAPADNARAYVTTLAGEARGQVLGPRVLAQSLRSAGAKGDIIVLVPVDKASGSNVDALRRDGLTVHIVPRGLQTASGDIASEDLMTKIFLWSLTSYQRVVYLDPRSLIQKNPDALFLCEGFCAAGAVPLSETERDGATASRGQDDDEGFESVGTAWQPSTSVMVLEPSLQVHQAMLEKLTTTTATSIASSGNSGQGSRGAQAFLSEFLEAGDNCTPFEDLDGPAVSRWGGLAGAGAGIDAGGYSMQTTGAWGDLEDALQPVVLLNRANMPRCAIGRERTSDRLCHRLPYSYAAPSTDFNVKGTWGSQRASCALCDETEPHIVHFADDDAPWKRLAYLHKPLFWRWNKFREQLDRPYGSIFSPWLLFLIPSVVLAFARLYYKTVGLPTSHHKTNSSGDGVKKRRSRSGSFAGQLAVLPASGMPGSHDGGAVGASLTMERGSSKRSVCAGGGREEAVDANSVHPCPQLLQAGLSCSILTALVAVCGFAYFRATRALAREVVDARWHPLISIAVYNAWLCCALVLGLYLIDYVYYLLTTRARTFLRDATAVTIFVSTVSFLHARKGTSWAVAVGLGVIALGVGHGSRPDAMRRLSSCIHFRCITASCLLGALASLVVCYGAASSSSHEVASRRVQTAAANLQMVFTALVYASVIGGHRLRASINEVGRKLDATARSTAVSCTSLDKLVAVSGTSEVVHGELAVSEKKTENNGCDSQENNGVCGDQPSSSSGVWALVVSVLALIKGIVWRRRVVASCVALLVLWPLSSSFQSTTPGRRLEKYGQACLGNPAGFVEAGGKRLAKVCGAEQALRPVKSGAYFEAFRQDKLCLEVAGGGFLTLGRVHVAQACTPENQFVFQQVQSPKAKKAKPGSRDALSSAPAAGTRDAGEYCVYNPTSGFYLSAQSRPKASCTQLEHWFVKPAPSAPGLSGDSSKKSSQSMVFMLLHPDFLSRGPLLTLYGYLAAATVLLIARAIFAMLASAKGETAMSRGTGGGSGGSESSGAAKHRHGGLGPRRSSRGRNTRSRLSGEYDCTGYLGDAGYAGDAEAGGAEHGHGMGRSKSFGKGGRGQSDRAVLVNAVSSGEEDPSCRSLGRTFSATEKGLMGEGRSGRTKSSPTVDDNGDSAAGTRTTHVRSARDAFLGKLFSGLCFACDATLLAGVWCLVPTHFAQALSALTNDHNAAIQQGLGMDALNGENAAVASDAWARGLEEGTIVLKADGAVAGGSLFGLGDLGIDAGGEPDALPVPSCDGMAWWILAMLVRWHLLFVLVAFCHLHGAVQASTAATQRGRDRRTGKRITSERVAFWGLRAGERVAMRLRTALGVLALLCVATTATGAGFGGGGTSAAFVELHARPAWGKCAPAAGLDGTWGGVSPLLVFAILAAGAGVYMRAGATSAVRVGAGVWLVVTGSVISAAVGRTYFVLALAALGMDWAAWGIAGLLSCVCYQKPESPKLGKDSGGSGGSFEADESAATDHGRGGSASKRSGVGGAARLRTSDTRRGLGGAGVVETKRRKAGTGGTSGAGACPGLIL